MWGHGLRERLCFGPMCFGGPPKKIVLRVRRYLCRACERTCTVVPRGVCPGRIYLVGAIALAFVWWTLVDDGATAASVRRRVSPHQTPSHRPDPRDWAQLRRWAKAADVAEGLLPKERAERIAGMCVGRSPPSTRQISLAHRAYLGAKRQPL